MREKVIDNECRSLYPKCPGHVSDECERQIEAYADCVSGQVYERPEFPERLEQCLVNIPGYDSHDESFVYLVKNGKHKEKIKIGRAINKHCPEYNNAFQRWLLRSRIYGVVGTAVKKAMEYRITRQRENVFEKLRGWHGTSDPNYSFVITDDPLDVVLKSETRPWEKRSCERIGGSYGDPGKWLKTGYSCGFCSDIEQGNAVVYLYDNGKGKVIGRLSLRWCKTDDGKTGIGLEPDWYGKTPNKELLDELKEILGSDPNLTINYVTCKTPYVYKGYSDRMRSGNTKITYTTPFAKKGISKEVMEILREYDGKTLYFYNVTYEAGWEILSCIEYIEIEERNAEEIKDMLEYYSYYTDDPEDFFDVFLETMYWSGEDKLATSFQEANEVVENLFLNGYLDENEKENVLKEMEHYINVYDHCFVTHDGEVYAYDIEDMIAEIDIWDCYSVRWSNMSYMRGY